MNHVPTSWCCRAARGTSAWRSPAAPQRSSPRTLPRSLCSKSNKDNACEIEIWKEKRDTCGKASTRLLLTKIKVLCTWLASVRHFSNNVITSLPVMTEMAMINALRYGGFGDLHVLCILWVRKKVSIKPFQNRLPNIFWGVKHLLRWACGQGLA